MIYIRKRQSAACRRVLQSAVSNKLSYSDLSSEDKNIIKDSLLEEQGYLCAYCMCRLDKDKKVKLEHFVSQKKDSSLALSYDNMLAVCDGGEGRPYEQQTCDTHKRDDPIKANPTNSNVTDTIYYKKSGIICSTDSNIDDDLNKTLNLNYPDGFLIRDRKNVIDYIRSQIKSTAVRKENVRQLLIGLKKEYESDKVKKMPYVGIAKWYVDKKLNGNI